MQIVLSKIRKWRAIFALTENEKKISNNNSSKIHSLVFVS